MNYIKIFDLTDFHLILGSSIYLSINEYEEQKEIYNNCWGIMLDNELAKRITVDELAEFISNLIKFRSEDICRIQPTPKATLYIWFDFQALRLCFNILSGEDRTLPFGCRVNLIDNPYPILKEFIKVAYNNALYGNYLGITKIIERGDPEFDKCINEEMDLDEFIIDVWKMTLPFNELE